ncbi:MAG: hypothetical protein WD969_09905 [Paracoccaceae bacterium]
MSRSIAARTDPLPRDPETPSGGNDRAPWSEDAVARRFVAEHGGDWRSLVVGKRWLHWDGARWRRDEKLLVLERIRATCRAAADIAAAAGKDGEAGGHTTGSARTLAAELRERGFEPVRSGKARGWRGIGLRRSGSPT